MAEAIVGLLIAKLGAALVNEAATSGASVICSEASALKGLFGEISEAKDELESMQAYLKGAEQFKDTDETTGLFVERIRGFAFEIEDVVDELTYKLGDKHGGFAAKMKKRIKHVKTWRRLAHKLKDINVRLQAAKQKKEHYAMPEIGRNEGGSAHQVFSFTRDEDLVGITEHKQQLIQWLTSDMQEERSKITTVWGMPGVGKTTLVAHVYKNVKVSFDAAAWITVSESYHAGDLLKRIAKEFGIPVDMSNTEIRSLAETIYEYLQGKRYILILDDVWTNDVWSEIRTILPSSGRLVITSRKHEVSLLATNMSSIHLEPLEEDNSWELFCKSSFWNDADRKCPPELQSLAWNFVKKCEGLPIAIVCLGSLLSGKGQSLAEWKKVYDELELQLVKNVMPRVETILKVSLDDLPYDLRNCFLHCALFPEDYSIKRRTVMRHWIAAGFIEEKVNKTLEEVAEGYLIELVNRSLLQVIERNYTGRLKCCQMHDVIRLVALNKASEERFGKVYDGSGAFSIERTRRISIQSGNLQPLSESDATHVRAIHVFFNRYLNIDLLRPVLESSNLLSTLDLQGTSIKMLPTEVFNLFNLRYLGLRYTDIGSLPEEIGRLQNLEVLDAGNSALSYLPNNIVKLQRLRYLFACCVTKQGEFKPFSGVKVPSGIRNLTSLHVLQCVEASSEILRGVAALIQLRTFAVCNVENKHSADLINAIKEMRHLLHLVITAISEEVLQLEGLCLPLTVYKLSLEGQLEKTSIPQVISSWSPVNNLTLLRLSFSNLDEECFSSLSKLRGLCRLDLNKAFEGKKLHFTAGSFPKLWSLSICDAPKLNQVEIEEGAMASLAEFCLSVCPELKFLPHGVEHLTTLDELSLHDTSEELIEKLRQKREANECSDDLTKIRHIKKVTVVLPPFLNNCLSGDFNK
ncbi:hypothetical protein ACQJBY_014562 [Aegilops geniculata]